MLQCSSGGGSPWSRGGLPGPGGGSPRSGGGLPGLGGFSLVPGGSAWSRGVYLVRGGSPETPPPVNRITDACKNITLATTSLRPVKIGCVAYAGTRRCC